MTAPMRQSWIDKFDQCCDTMIRLRKARDHGEQNVSEFNATLTLIWRTLQIAPQDLFEDCRDTAYLLIADYFGVEARVS